MARRILVVDDETHVRSLVVRALRREDYLCDEAADGIEAEEKAAAQRYDAVITDLRMPRMHGHKLVQQLLEQKKPPIVIVYTGVVERRLADDLFDRGVADILYKPMPLDLLAAKVRALIARRDRQQAILAPSQQMASDIASATSVLRDQLKQVQDSFQQTIADLERQRAELEKGFVGSVRVLANIITQGPKSEGSHAVRVAELAIRMAAQLKISSKALREIEMAALLHDIGQFGMPDIIRFKPPWELVGDELVAYQRYPLIGATLLAEIEGADRIANLVEAHAENHDGSGFPAGKRGDRIPLGARIIHIADGFDTAKMNPVTEDPWRGALAHIARHAGSLYDPALVKIATAELGEMEQAGMHERIRRKSFTELEPGDILAEDIYDADGCFLARRGLVATRGIIKRLRLLVQRDFVNVRVAHAPNESTETPILDAPGAPSS